MLEANQPNQEINQLLQKGIALHKQGLFPEAQAIYEQILNLQPEHFDALVRFGMLAAQTNNLELSVDLWSKALRIDPFNSPTHLYIGNALRELKEFKKAIAHFNKSISFNPDFAIAYAFRGIALHELNRFEDAIESYEKAISLNPNYFEAFANSALASHELNRFEDAIKNYDIAIALKPDFAEAYSNRGNTLKELNRFEDAIKSYDIAIALKPDFAEAYSNRGNVLKALKQFEDAIESYDKAIALKPDFAEVYYSRGITLQEMVLLNDARHSLMKSLELKPDFGMARWAITFLSIPPVLTKIENFNVVREHLSKELEKLDEWFSPEKLDGAYKLIGTSQPFYLAYQEINNKELFLKYGNICNRLMSHCPILNNLQRNKKVKSGKIKIGLIGEQFRNHSVWNAITKGWLFNLDKNKFEVHIFDLGNVCDDQTKFAKKIAASYTKKQYSIIEWANVIVSKDIEVLIYPEIGMHALTLQLANLRLSSIQIAAWGHPETSGLPTIDYFISAELFETAYSQNAYTENLIKLPNLGCNFSRNPNPTSDIDMQKFGLDAEVPILLCPGVPFKYAPDYDWIIVDIAKRLGKCKLVFFNYQKNWTSIFKMRLEKSFNNANLILDDYVIFLPWLKTAEFYGLMKRADVFLDTIGFSGFNTAMQAIECALPIVTREGKFMRGRLASGILKRMGMSELITNTEEKYIELAVNLAKDQEYRNRVSEKIIEMRDILYEDVDPIRALEDFLIIKCRRYHDSEF